MICDGDYTVRYIDLPLSVPGVTFLQDGHYNVYINSSMSTEQQEDALRHELEHLNTDDFDVSKSLEEVEPYRCGQASIPTSFLCKPTEITTIGQLLQTVVGWEKGKRNPSYKSNVGNVSVDIMGE